MSTSESGEYKVRRFDDPEEIAKNLGDPRYLWEIIMDRATAASKGISLHNICVHGNILLLCNGTVQKIKPSTYKRKEQVNRAFGFQDLADLSKILGFEITSDMLEDATPPECNNTDPNTGVAA